MWKAVPVIILAGLAGLLLRELLQWFERSVTRGIRSRRNAQKTKSTKQMTEGSSQKAAGKKESLN